MAENDQNSHSEVILTAEELDAIGEIMNISMGASATAVSAMLDRQVTITTPKVEQERFQDVDCSELEPAIVVKIDYVEGLQGSNIIMLRRHDMQLILNLLMGNETADDDDNFEFDEMSMSAACEVMNQMMGASSTALSEILSMTVNISTPTAHLVDSSKEIYSVFGDLEADERVVNVAFKMSIKGVIDSDFSCFLPTQLTRKIISYVQGDAGDEPETASVPTPSQPSAPIPEPVAPQMAPISPVAPPPEFAPMAPPPQTEPVPPPYVPPAPEAFQQPPQGYPAQPPQEYPPQVPQGYPPQGQMPPYPQQPGMEGASPYNMPQGYMQPYMQPQGYPYMPQYPYPYGGYPPQPAQPQVPAQKTPPVNVKKAQFPNFSDRSGTLQPLIGPNANLLMGVPLEVSIVIGKAKRRIREILEFGPGTVVDLDKQTGAPAEIIVNGQLLAYGDVIVIGDNFGVRITEIVGTKDLLESLDAGV